MPQNHPHFTRVNNLRRFHHYNASFFIKSTECFCFLGFLLLSSAFPFQRPNPITLSKRENEINLETAFPQYATELADLSAFRKNNFQSILKSSRNAGTLNVHFLKDNISWLRLSLVGNHCNFIFKTERRNFLIESCTDFYLFFFFLKMSRTKNDRILIASHVKANFVCGICPFCVGFFSKCENFF